MGFCQTGRVKGVKRIVDGKGRGRVAGVYGFNSGHILTSRSRSKVEPVNSRAV